MTKVKIY